MKRMTWLAILLLPLTTGCANMSSSEKQTAYIVGGLVVVAVIISTSDDNGNQALSCSPYPVPGGHITVCE